ncbi:MAG TPA: hypothetical protein VH741_01860 [Candidatus Limnocylindrales bacterium]|jgi:hypothetical protein
MSDRPRLQLGDGPSIWRRPIQVGLLVAVIYVVLAAANFPLDVPSGTALMTLAGVAFEGFVVGFLIAVVILTYIRVSERRS